MIAFIVKWTIKKGYKQKAIAGLKELAKNVEENEKGALLYLVHTPDSIQFDCSDGRHQSLPTPSKQEVVFIEEYRDEEAFCKHVIGEAYTKFLQEYGECFLSSNGGPYVSIEFLRRQAGFIRKEALSD
jgi:quinol monooxygenase YgiN